jgi:acyl-CoA thioesterase-2
VDAKSFLSMTRESEDVFTFSVDERLVTPGKFLFGGCGLAAGLVALEEASGRPAIWASAQYLSYAPLDAMVTVSTQLLVTGNNVTQARATAAVDGREILTVNAALGSGHLSAATSAMSMPKVRDPEDCPPLERPFSIDGTIFQHVDCRVAIPSGERKGDRDPKTTRSGIWSRIPGHLAPSAATLAIFGDFVAGGVSQLLGQATMGRSLDNTIRIAQLEPAEWVLCEIKMHALVGGFAQGTGYLWSPSGTLLATASQSIAAKLWEPWSPES